MLLAASTAALAACGSSSNNAPVVYGTEPTAGRVYNSPEEMRAARAEGADRQRPARQASAPASSSRSVYRPPSAGGPSKLTPVTTEIYESELPDAPTYVSARETVKSPSAGGRGGRVAVRKGDTVYGVARRTGASPQAIIAENNLRAPYTLAVGQTLRIPDASRKIDNAVARPASNRSAEQPVTAATMRGSSSAQSARTVRGGETLYSIARETGASVDAIARANRLRAPYTLAVGQRLVIPGGAGSAGSGAPLQREASREDVGEDVGSLARSVSYTSPAEPAPTGSLFDWPVRGAVIGEYGSSGAGRRNEGVNIAAPVGTPVRAAASGEVVYRGSELDGYGNLLLVKHDDGYVTAYAHNDAMLVRKGERVEKGQMIAKVGQTGSVTEPQLHFEIRQNLKSVDPLALLEG